jgi:hypothetical protein
MILQNCFQVIDQLAHSPLLVFVFLSEGTEPSVKFVTADLSA